MEIAASVVESYQCFRGATVSIFRVENKVGGRGIITQLNTTSQN
jgi:hypothetical protein